MRSVVRNIGYRSQSAFKRRMFSVKFPQSYEDLNHPVQSNPSLGQFKNPLFHCFLIASSTYMMFHIVSLKLEHDKEQQRYTYQEKELESSIQTIIDQKKRLLDRRWYHIFWKS